jgi:RNA polymerase sigma factor (TIGR02999 family)
MTQHAIPETTQRSPCWSDDTIEIARREPLAGHVLEQPPPGLTLCDLLREFYSDVRVIAHARLRCLPASRTLHTSTVLQEAILRLVKRRRDAWENQVFFFADVKQAVQQVVADYVRRKSAAKRDVVIVHGDTTNENLIEGAWAEGAATSAHKLDVSEAMEKLRQEHPRASMVVLLRFFYSLTTPEIAEALSVSERCVERDWVFARSWLEHELKVH